LDFDIFRKVQTLMGVTPDYFETVLMVRSCGHAALENPRGSSDRCTSLLRRSSSESTANPVYPCCLVSCPLPRRASRMGYIAVGSGAKRENRAMVYAGHYVTKNGHRTPTIIVVKCGMPGEAKDKNSVLPLGPASNSNVSHRHGVSESRIRIEHRDADIRRGHLLPLTSDHSVADDPDEFSRTTSRGNTPEPLISLARIGAELFTICLVTCYSEGEDSVRGTVDSIASTNYSDSRTYSRQRDQRFRRVPAAGSHSCRRSVHPVFGELASFLGIRPRRGAGPVIDGNVRAFRPDRRQL
jgi:hypothetical protein